MSSWYILPTACSAVFKKQLHQSKSSTTALNVELYKLKEESKAAIRDALDQSLPSEQAQTHQNIIEEIKRNREEIIELKKELTNNTDSVLKETAKFISYADGVGTQMSSPSPTPIKMAKSIVSELNNEDRRKNIILYGIEEDANNKQQWIKDMFDDIEFPGVNFGFEPIGAVKEGENRPIRIRLSNKTIASNILSISHKLKGAGHSHLYIAPDRTYMERKAREALVTKLKVKIKEDPATKWCIRAGKIVQNGLWSANRSTDAI